MAESKDNGRIVYIEPNNIPAIKAAGYAGGVKSDENPDGLIPDNITWNPEDLNISVDLQVIIPSREHRENMNYEKNALFNPKYASYKSFFSGIDIGGNNMLTDDYTNISYEEIRINGAGSRESLGVTSINIKFDANLYPVVTMKFTDVRAASLMAPAEQAFLDKRLKSEQICRNFFSALFKFPYPLFNLTVKGMFGTRVTFRLSVIDFKSNYNGDTGNYDVTVTFMGNIYGLYTDIPFRFLLIAPYIGATGGSTNEYWTRETETGGRFFYNDHGKSGNKIMTFLDYVRNYKEALSGADSSADESEAGINGLTGVEAEKQILNHVMDRYNAFISYPGRLTESIEGGIYRLRSKKVTGGDNDEDSVIFFDKGITEMKFASDKAEAIIKEAKEIKSGFDEAGIGAPSIISKIAELDASASPSLNLSGPYVDGAGKLTPLGLSLDGYQRNVLENFKDDIGGKTLNGKYGYHIKENAIDSITKKLSSLDEEADILKKKASEEMLTRFKEGIGFEPTVENAFRMIFAHMDTFLHYFYDCIDRIPLERTLSQFSIKIDDTDIDSPGQENAFMPPFTAFYRESKKNGDQPERYYPGDSGSNSNLRGIHEVKFVEDIFNGISSLAELIRQPDPDMNESEEETETGDQTADTGKTFGQKFHPLSITDIFYEGVNPYNVLTPGWESPEKLLYFFEARMYALRKSYSVNRLTEQNASKIVDNEIDNLSKSKLWQKIIENGSRYNNCNVKPQKLSDKISSHVYKITDVHTDETDIGGESFFWDDGSTIGPSKKGFQNFFDLSSKYSNESISMFSEEINEKNVSLEVKFQNEWHPKKYAIPVPLSEAIVGGQIKKVPFYDTKGSTDIYDREKHLVGKQVFRFLYDAEKYNLVAKDEENSGAYRTNTFSDFKVEKYANRGGERISAWIPFIPNFGENDYNNRNYFFSDEFWALSADTYFQAAAFLGSLLGPNEKFNFNDGFIKKISKFAYLAYCSYVYGCLNGKQEEYRKILNRVEDGLMSPYSITFFSESKSEKELRALSDYFKDWADSEFSSILKSLDSERKSENKIRAKISRGKGAISSLFAALEGKEVRLFDPDGEFMRKFMDFYWKTATPIYVNGRGWKSGTSNGGYSGTGPSLEPYQVEQFVAIMFLNKIYNRVNGLTNANVSEPNEDDSPYMNSPIVEVDFSKASTSQRNSLYYTLKNLYDRWISTYSENQFHLNSPEQEEADKRKRFVGTDDANGATDNGIESEFNSFLYVDKFYNDISKKFIFNPTKFGNLLEMELDASTNHSVISFISEFCKNNKLLFRCLPVRNSLYNLETIMDMFTPMSPYSGKNRMGLGVGNTYLIMYTYEPSHKLALINDQKEGVGYKNDSFDIADITGKITDEAKKLLNGSYDPDELRLNVCAFGVTPNAQNQSYFTKVSVGMDNPRVTEQAIKNTLELASMAKKGGISAGNGNGQDIYSVYSNRSYDCRVDMLGCMNIMPMMYFQLNNLPMFRGAYMITSVEHNIQNNTMTTSFVGQRQSKYLIPLDSDIFNIAGLSEIVSNTVNNMSTRATVATGVVIGSPGTPRSFSGNVIHQVQGKKSPNTFYTQAAVEQVNHKWYCSGKGEYWNTRGVNDYGHYCASGVKAFIAAGFVGYDDTNTGKNSKAAQGIKFNGRYIQGSGFAMNDALQHFGFRVVATLSEIYDKNGNVIFQPQEGDVAVMKKPSGGVGHVCMYTPSGWVSDCVQKNLFCYNGGNPVPPAKGDESYVMILRYWGNINRTEMPKYGEVEGYQDNY